MPPDGEWQQAISEIGRPDSTHQNTVSVSVPTSMSARIVEWGLQDKGGVNLEYRLYGTVLDFNDPHFHFSNALLHLVENWPVIYRNLLC